MDSDTDDEQEEQAAQLSREQLLSLNPFALPRFSKRRLRYMAAFDSSTPLRRPSTLSATVKGSHCNTTISRAAADS